jgi:hypothetical protein
LTATDYFTKWTESIPLKHSQDEKVISLLETNIFSRFDIPLEIITDNKPAFIYAKLTIGIGADPGFNAQEHTNKSLTIGPFGNTCEADEVSPEVEARVVSGLKCLKP